MSSKQQPTLIAIAVEHEAPTTYAPIPSVWDGEDSELLERMLDFYPHRKPARILDATVNSGRFWRGSKRKIIGMDISATHRPSVLGDNMKMPFSSGTFDVVVYDPPHIPNQGKDKQKDFHTRFGLGERSAKEHGYSFAYLYPLFVKEAMRVLRPDGVLFCKIADYIHNHRYQWAHLELTQAAIAVGFVRAIASSRFAQRRLSIRNGQWRTTADASIVTGWCFVSRIDASRLIDLHIPLAQQDASAYRQTSNRALAV